MKQINRIRVLCIPLLFFVSAFGQVQTPRYVSITPNTRAFYEYLPQGYEATKNKTYPLLLFIGGIGNWGDGSPEMLPRAMRGSPASIINQGWFPKYFIVNCQRFRLLVFTPQFVQDPTPSDVDSVLNYIIKHYKVDTTRIYLTGLSWGGGLVWNYAGSKSAYANRLAAMVPISGARELDKKNCRIIAAANLPVWATHNDGDTVVSVDYSIQNVANVNLPPAPNPPAKLTIFHSKQHDAWTKTYNPHFKEDGMNIYEWMLQYHKGIIPPPSDPTLRANAGPDKKITLPVNSVLLKGKGTDTYGKITAYQWRKVSGPDAGAFTNLTNTATIAHNLSKGIYLFEFSITNSCGYIARDTVRITVIKPPNKPPKANAGPNQLVDIPADTVRLQGSGTDEDGTIVSYSWSKLSGPASSAFNNTAVDSPLVSHLVHGTYVFRLTVTDNDGAMAHADVKVIVNYPPKVNAGPDQTIDLPKDSVQFNGSASDTDGIIKGYIWRKISGPGTLTFSPANAPKTTVSGLHQGTYYFELKAVDNSGARSRDTVKVVVNGLPPGSETKYIKVNVYGGTNPYNDSTWNNWNVGATAKSNVSSGVLNYSDSTASGISATLSRTQLVTDNGMYYSGNMAPPEVLRYASADKSTRTLTISGLSNFRKYNIELYASSNDRGEVTSFTINNGQQSINVYENFDNKAVFTDLVPGVNGKIVVTINKRLAYNYLNGFIITEQGLNYPVPPPPADTIPADAPVVSFYPNPVSNQLFLKVSSPVMGKVEVNVVSVSGSIVKSFQLTKDQKIYIQTLPLYDLAAGTYFIMVRLGNWRETKKIIKQ